MQVPEPTTPKKDVADTIRTYAIAFFWFVVALNIQILVFVGLMGPSVPSTDKPVKANCTVWADGILTCNLFNPSDEPANVAGTVSFDCSKAVNGKRDYSSVPYHETVIATNVPENGWATAVVNSEGFSRYYKSVSIQLEEEAQELLKVVKAGGLRAADLRDDQKEYFNRNPMDVCVVAGQVGALTMSGPKNNSKLGAFTEGLLRGLFADKD